VQLGPADPKLHNNLGSACVKVGRLDEAVAEFREAIGLKHDYIKARRNLGDALKQQGKLDEALAEVASALRIDDAGPALHSLHGDILAAQGKVNEAMAAYARALDRDPENADAAAALWALWAYERTAPLASGPAEAHARAGGVLVRTSKYEAAIRSFRQALEIQPLYFDARYALARLLCKARRFNEGIAEFERCAKAAAFADKSVEERIELLTLLACACRDAGRKGQAARWWRKALDIRADHPRGEDVLKGE